MVAQVGLLRNTKRETLTAIGLWGVSGPVSNFDRSALSARPQLSTRHYRARRPKSMAQLIDDHVSAKQCRRAIAALMEYALKQQQKREENELLPGKEENIWLQIAVKEVHAEAKLKPHRMCVNSDFDFSMPSSLRCA